MVFDSFFLGNITESLILIVYFVSFVMQETIQKSTERRTKWDDEVRLRFIFNPIAYGTFGTFGNVLRWFRLLVLLNCYQDEEPIAKDGKSSFCMKEEVRPYLKCKPLLALTSINH